MDFKCEFNRVGCVNDTPINQKAIIDCKVQRPFNKVVEVHMYNSKNQKMVSSFDYVNSKIFRSQKLRKKAQLGI